MTRLPDEIRPPRVPPPATEVRPIEPEPEAIEERLDALEWRGALVRSNAARQPLKAVARRAGALERFLAERNE